MKKINSFKCGLLGSIIGFIIGITLIVIILISGNYDKKTIEVLGPRIIYVFIFSVVALIGVFISRKKSQFGALLMVMCAIAGIMYTTTLYIIPSIFLMISGFAIFSDLKNDR